jgi:Protein of unknown function (DUF2924)
MRNSKRTRTLQRRTIEDEIALFRDLDLKGLRTHWQNEFGRAAPEHLTRYLLFRILAYRIQADRLGDLDGETLKILARSAGQEDQPSGVSRGLAELDQRRFSPPPGTVLFREWDRKSHRVMVLQDGFAWNGKTFDSLSQVAFAITGTKWNAPASSACGIGDPNRMLETLNDFGINRKGSMCHLHAGLDRPRP